MFEWFAATLRSYSEIAIFLALGIGYYVGRFSFRGVGLGAVTSTLLAAVLIGQLGITVSPNVKSVFFLLFLFAVGYGVGPQFVRGIAKDGLPQALFSVLVGVFCLGSAVLAGKLAGYDLGYTAGLYAGSQTISASMGLATDAINRIGLPPEQSKALLDAMPIAYAVTYIFGTIGSAILLALIGPKLLGIDLVAACKAYEDRQGGGKELGGAGSAWHRWDLRAFRVQPGGRAVGLRAIEAEALVPDARVFIMRVRRNGTIMDAPADTVLREGDVIAVAGVREVRVDVIGPAAKEVDTSSREPPFTSSRASAASPTVVKNIRRSKSFRPRLKPSWTCRRPSARARNTAIRPPPTTGAGMFRRLSTGTRATKTRPTNNTTIERSIVEMRSNSTVRTVAPRPVVSPTLARFPGPGDQRVRDRSTCRDPPCSRASIPLQPPAGFPRGGRK